MEFSCPEANSFFEFLQNFGILNEKQYRSLTSDYGIGNHRVIFLLADFFKRLSPSDAYDLALRLYQIFQRFNDEDKFKKEFGEPEAEANRDFLKIIENRNGFDLIKSDKKCEYPTSDQSENFKQSSKMKPQQRKERSNKNSEVSLQYPLKMNNHFENGHSKTIFRESESENKENNYNQFISKKKIERKTDSPDYSVKIAYAKSLSGNKELTFEDFQRNIEMMVDNLKNYQLKMKLESFNKLKTFNMFHYNKSPEQIKRCVNKNNYPIPDDNNSYSPYSKNINEEKRDKLNKKEKSKVYDRLYNEALIRRENESFNKEKAKDNELRGCSFQPLKEKNCKVYLPLSLTNTGESIISRMTRPRHSPECLKELQMKLTERELEHCTFRPEINKNLRDRSSPRLSSRNTFDRLYNEAESKRASRAEREKHHERQLIKDCTFKPQICRSKSGSYFHEDDKDSNIIEGETAITSSQECTFRPKSVIEGGEIQASSEKKREVFERLYSYSKEERKSESISLNRRINDENVKSTSQNNKKSEKCHETFQNKTDSKKKGDLFYERFEFYMKKRTDNIKKLSDEAFLQSGLSFTPKTTTNNKKYSRRSSTPTVSLSNKKKFLEKSEELNQKIQQYHSNQNEKHEINFSQDKQESKNMGRSSPSLNSTNGESKREREYRSKEQEIKMLEEEFLRIYEQHKQGI